MTDIPQPEEQSVKSRACPASQQGTPSIVTQNLPSEANPWEIARRLIEHEDNLVNQRLVWLFTMQGFLFAALAVTANTIVTRTQDRGTLLWWIMLGVSLVGFLSPLFVWTSLQSAFQQLRTVTNWWKDQWSERLLIAGTPYPRARGLPWFRKTLGIQPLVEYEPWVSRLARWLSPVLNPRNIPVLLSMVWLAVIIVVFAYSAHLPVADGQEEATAVGLDRKSTATVTVLGLDGNSTVTVFELDGDLMITIKLNDK